MKYHTLFFFGKLGKISQNLSSAAVVIGALRVNYFVYTEIHLAAPLEIIYIFDLIENNPILILQCTSLTLSFMNSHARLHPL